ITMLHRAAQRLRRRKLALLSFGIVGLYLLVGLLGVLGLLPDYQERVGSPYQAPSLAPALVLGTDIFGRSVLYKILAGTKTAMMIGLLVPAISVPVGVALGAFAGYYGGWVDA